MMHGEERNRNRTSTRTVAYLKKQERSGYGTSNIANSYISEHFQKLTLKVYSMMVDKFSNE